MFLSKYGTARHIYIPMIKRGVVDFALSADWTPATGDVKISKDGAAAANVTNLPGAITMGNTAVWDFSLTATEMQAAQVVVTVSDAATKAVEDQTIVIETYGNASAQHPFDLATATVVASSIGSGGITSSSFAADAINAAAIATDAIGSAELAATAVTEIQTGLATSTAVSSAQSDITTILGRLPTALVAGRIDASVGAAAADTLTASALATDAVTEIVNAVTGATSSELASVPSSSSTLQQKLDWLFELALNKRTQTSTTETVYKADGTTALATSTKSDDGTTMTRGHYA